MAKKGKNKIIVRLVSEESTYTYTTYKNSKMEGGFEGSGKLRLRKYDPSLRKHVWFKEAKIKK